MPYQILTVGDRWRFSVLAACAAVFALGAPFTGVRVDWMTFLPIYLSSALLIGVGVAYRLLGRDEGIAAATLVAAQIALYAHVVVLNNYLGLELRRPLIDTQLAAIDRALGMDWWAYVTWVKSNPYVARFLTLAYFSSLPQVVVAVLILGFNRRFERLDRFALAFMFSSALTIATWSVFPSFGALPLHYAQGLPDPTFSLAMSKREALTLLSLHAGPTPTLRMEEMLGLIGCPSFHTALAMLSIYALWGMRWVGKAAVALNLVVFVSIPADGGHHFIDVGVGAAITALSIYLAHAAMRSKTSPAPLQLGENVSNAEAVSA